MVQTATNPQTGEKFVLVGNEWKPVAQSATNSAGEKAYLVGDDWITDKPGSQPRQAEAANPFATQRAKEYDPTVSGGKFAFDKFKRGVVGGGVNIPGYMADLAQLPIRGLSALGVKNIFGEPLFREEEGYMDATKKTQDFGDKYLGVDRGMKPPHAAGKYLGNVAEFAGASLLPSGLLINAAKHKGLALAAEAAATAGGGVMSQFGGDIAEAGGVNRAWGEIPLGITGSMAGYAMPTLLSKAKGATSTLAAAEASKGGKQIASIVKAENSGPAIDASFETAAAIEKVTGKPFNPTLAGRTKSGIIGQIEKENLGRNIASAESAIATQNANVANLREYTSAVFPSTTDVSRTAYASLKKATGNIDDAAARIAAQQAAIAKGVTGKDLQPLGQGLDDIRAGLKSAEKTRLNEGIESVYRLASKKNVSEPMDDVVSLVKKIAGDDRGTYQSKPQVFSEILDNYGKPPPHAQASGIVDVNGRALPSTAIPPAPTGASFQELHSLYKKTNEQLAVAVGARDGTQAHYLGKLKDALQEKLKKFEGPEYADLGQSFRKWNAEYSAYAKAHKEGVGGKMAAETRYGNMLHREDVVNKFFTPTGVDDFARLYKGDTTAKQLFEDGVLNLFAKRTGVMTDGIVSPSKAAEFIKSNSDALNKIPGLRDKLMNAATATDALIEKSARLAAAKKQLNDSIVAKVANTEDPMPIIQKALTDRKELVRLLQTSKDGQEAVAHALATAIPNAAKKSGMTVSEFMKANEMSLRPAFAKIGKDHYNNMKVIADGIDTLAAGAPPSHPALAKFNTDPIEAFTGQTPASIVSQYRATQITRQSSPVHMATTGLAKFWIKLSGENAKRMQEYILTSPEAARDFAAATRGGETAYMANKLRYHTIAAGVRSAGAASDELTKDTKE